MKIYTRRGDQGETDLFGGPRVAKDDPRVQAYGAIDELNACVGVAAVESGHEDLRALCRRIQGHLFDLGAYLAAPDSARRARSRIPELRPQDVKELEAQIDALEKELEPLRRFVLPGGTRASAAFHVARTVCRRAERSVVALDRSEPLGVDALSYLNRLSDLLFTLARVENRRAGVADVEWGGEGR